MLQFILAHPILAIFTYLLIGFIFQAILLRLYVRKVDLNSRCAWAFIFWPASYLEGVHDSLAYFVIRGKNADSHFYYVLFTTLLWLPRIFLWPFAVYVAYIFKHSWIWLMKIPSPAESK